MDLRRLFLMQWDRILAWICFAAAVVVFAVGWVGISGTAYAAEQLPYILSGGLGAVLLLGFGAVMWLSADLRDEWRKLDRIEERLGDRSVVSGVGRAAGSGAGMGSHENGTGSAISVDAPVGRL